MAKVKSPALLRAEAKVVKLAEQLKQTKQRVSDLKKKPSVKKAVKKVAKKAPAAKKTARKATKKAKAK